MTAGGEAAYRKEQYTEAAQLFSKAQRSYEVARRDAQELAAKPSVPTALATETPAPSKPPAVVSPTVALTPLPTVAVEAPAPVVATPAPATPAPKAAASDETAVRQLLATFERAIEEKDLSLYKRLRPGLKPDEERRLRDAFNNVSSQQVDYSVDSISFDGDKATLQVTRTGRVSGQTVPPVRQVLRLVRSDAGWIIAEIGQ